MKRLLGIFYFGFFFSVLGIAQNNYTTESILQQGTFFQLKTDKEGIYKIDYNFLSDLGINAGDINMANLRLYGNGGGMLPEVAGQYTIDDLLENSIEVFDLNNNNSFDKDDYILFFAESPHQWYYNNGSNTYTHVSNLYDNYNYYYLNFDIGIGKRITTETTNVQPDYTTTDFDFLSAHELELTNLIKSGRVWFGETFTPGYPVSASFSIPAINTAQNALLQTEFAVRSTNSNSGLALEVNGNVAKTFSVAKVASGTYVDYARLNSESEVSVPATQNYSLRLGFSSADANAKAWLDYITIQGRAQLNWQLLQAEKGQIVIRDKNTRNAQNGSRFVFSQTPTNLRVWNVSDITQITTLPIVANAATTEQELPKLIAFDGSDFYKPQKAAGKIPQQNLHADISPEYIIITYPDFEEASNALAEFHLQESGLNTLVVSVKEIYHEFASGKQDITAIRNFVKMFYDRANAQGNTPPKYLLLMGDASYDYKNITIAAADNSNLVPTYQSPNSIHTVDSYCSDDYFGLLDNGEGGSINNSSNLDIAIGRFPVRTPEEAMTMVEKVKFYKSAASRGDWLNNICFVADDGDNNLHFNHAERHADSLAKKQKDYNIDKIYLDAFPQISTSGFDTYPDVNEAINQKIFKGTFIFNYVGHGGEKALASETVLDISMIRNWRNQYKLPLFITATCSFSRFDDPGITSAGEYVILNPLGGGIANITTLRAVTSGNNLVLNRSLLEHMFDKDALSNHLSIGEITRRGKNDAIGTGANNRKFTLLGDPALVLNYPKNEVITTEITTLADNDTLQALSNVILTGEIRNENNEKLENFNGIVNIKIFDKSNTISTLGQDQAHTGDAGSYAANFSLQNNILFSGSASVQNGTFTTQFVLPKDINYNYGEGKISYYALSSDGLSDASGYSKATVGGIYENATLDQEGPVIDIYLNDTNFVSGDKVDSKPLGLFSLFDENGINTAGIGIGHDLKALLSTPEGSTKSFTLNAYYEADINSFQSGWINYPFSDLSPGNYQLTVRAWDIYNNPSEKTIDFEVVESLAILLQDLSVYPNPVMDEANFRFEHNRSGDDLRIDLDIFSINGQHIFSQTKNITATGFVENDLHWQTDNNYGNKVPPGMYIYTITLTDSNGVSTQQSGKIVLLSN
ncbi:MAG: type IX secretion system sortase PorU [Chitinophagales bacterium]|nr:type IX secretion system sortase PorU [Bacteroidota bacterium]